MSLPAFRNIWSRYHHCWYLLQALAEVLGAALPPGVPSPVRRILSYGTDYTVDVAPYVDAADRILRITPLKPLTPSTGATTAASGRRA